MFREITRIKQKITNEECIQILKNEKRGILSMNGDDGYPYSIPMSYFYDEEKNTILFHGAKKGHKIDSLKKSNKVCFCVYDKGYVKEGEWALNIKSVVIFGKIHFINEIEDMKKCLNNIGLKFVNDQNYVDKEIEKYLNSVQCLELKIEHMSGKLVNES